MLNMNEDTKRLSGGFRSIEAKIRMIKERSDGKKYANLQYHKVLEKLSRKDGFSQADIDLLVAVNKVSGSMAHGNYAEAMEKIDKFIMKKYFPKDKLSRGGAKKIDLSKLGSKENILDAILNGTRTPVIADAQSDIYEAYVAARADGYIVVMDKLIEETMKLIDSKLAQ